MFFFFVPREPPGGGAGATRGGGGGRGGGGDWHILCWGTRKGPFVKKQRDGPLGGAGNFPAVPGLGAGFAGEKNGKLTNFSWAGAVANRGGRRVFSGGAGAGGGERGAPFGPGP